MDLYFLIIGTSIFIGFYSCYIYNYCRCDICNNHNNNIYNEEKDCFICLDCNKIE